MGKATKMYKKTKNRLGLDCEYSDEIAKDMLTIHNIHVPTFFMMAYGTTFEIKKTGRQQGEGFDSLTFELTTDDCRDGVLNWTLAV